MSASRNVMDTETAELFPFCQQKIFRDTSAADADKIPRMTETIHDRIEKLISDKGLSIAEAERLCGLGSGTLLKLLRNRDQMPNSRTVAKIAAGFHVAPTWLMTPAATGDEERPPPAADARIDKTAAVPDPSSLPKNVPVLGTAAGSHARGAFQFSGGTIDWVRRPPGLMGARDVYALYVEGSSMEPQFSPGDLIYIHPHRPARPGDPIVIQTKVNSDDDIEATIGIYLRRTEKYIVIKKHNPVAEVQILRNEGTVIHKIMTLNELFGI